MDHQFKQNKRTCDGNQGLGCAPNVSSRDEILRQLEGMVFADESTDKTRTDIEQKKRSKKRVLLWSNKDKRIIYCERRKYFL
jgi:hypothetical protein